MNVLKINKSIKKECCYKEKLQLEIIYKKIEYKIINKNKHVRCTCK